MSMRTILQHGGASAVAKQHAGIAILPIHNRRKLFRADDQHRVIGAGHDELLRDLESINEARASCFEIERRGAARADGSLHEARR